MGTIPPVTLPPDPPDVAGERDTLVAFLDYFRAVFLRKAAGLDAEQLGVRVAASSLTLGGLLGHLTMVEDYWFSYWWSMEPPGEPWASADWDADPDFDFTSAAGREPDDLAAAYGAAVARSRATIAAGPDLDERITRGDRTISRRWILVHMIEEYARHCGHADLIREAIDGQVDD